MMRSDSNFRRLNPENCCPSLASHENPCVHLVKTLLSHEIGQYLSEINVWVKTAAEFGLEKDKLRYAWKD